jgi:phosphatidylglycerophosphate synthase
VLDGLLRPVKDRVLAPVVSRAARHINPFLVTWLAFLSGLGSALFAYFGSVPWSLGLWLLGRVLDGLDGALAREAGTQSDFGGYLDIVLDIVVYTAIPLALAFGPGGPDAVGAAAVLMGVFYINIGSWMYLSALLEKRMAAGIGPTSVVMPTGLVEGSETVFFYSVFLLLPALAPELFLAMASLTLFTAIQRIACARRLLASNTR